MSKKIRNTLKLIDYIIISGFLLLLVGVIILCLSQEYRYDMKWCLIPFTLAFLLLLTSELYCQFLRKKGVIKKC